MKIASRKGGRQAAARGEEVPYIGYGNGDGRESDYAHSYRSGGIHLHQTSPSDLCDFVRLLGTYIRTDGGS